MGVYSRSPANSRIRAWQCGLWGPSLRETSEGGMFSVKINHLILGSLAGEIRESPVHT